MLTFPSRPATERLTPEVRAQLEDAAEAALDAAGKIIAILDHEDGDPDLEDGGYAEPSLGAPEGQAPQIVWLRGSDSDKEEGRSAFLRPGRVLSQGRFRADPLR